MKKAVIFICYNRPEYFEKVLDNWKKQDITDIDFYVNFDLGDRKAFKIYYKHLCSFFKFIKQDINERLQINNPKLGMAYNQFDASERLFNLNYDFVIQAEDDVIPANDYIKYMSFMSEKFNKDDKVLSIHGFNDKDNYYGLKNQHLIYEKSLFCAWGWGTWRHKWNYFRDYWYFEDWDTELTRRYSRDNKFGIYPRSTRSQNIGEKGEQMIDAYDKTFLQTTVTDIFYNTDTYTIG